MDGWDGGGSITIIHTIQHVGVWVMHHCFCLGDIGSTKSIIPINPPPPLSYLKSDTESDTITNQSIKDQMASKQSPLLLHIRVNRLITCNSFLFISISLDISTE